MSRRLPLLAALVAVLTAVGSVAAQTTLRIGETITARLAPADSQLQDGSHYRTYTFAAGKGDVITATMSSDDFDPNLILADATGNPLAKNDDGGGNCNARLSYALPASGTYRLYANTSARAEIGEYRLALMRGRGAAAKDTTCRGFGAVTGLIRPGQTVTGELKDSDPYLPSDSTRYQRWVLPLQANQTVTVDLRSNDFDAFVLLITGRGEKLAANDDGAGDCNARLVYKATSDHPVRVVVNTAGKFQTGKFALKVTDGALPVEPKGDCRRAAAAPSDDAQHTIAVGQSAEGRLSRSDHYRERDSTYVQTWAMSGTAGRTVTIDLESDDFDPFLFVAGPGLDSPLQDDDSGGNCNARLTVMFPQTGKYFVVVNTSNHDATGAFTLSVTSGAKPKSLSPCKRDR